MKLPSIAFVSLEFGIINEMKTYCGGLGILSGDIIKSANEQNYPMTGFTLLYKKGWFKQVIDEHNNQVARPDYWDYKKLLEDTNKIIKLNIDSKICHIKIWKYNLGSCNIYYFDTDLEQNDPLFREVSQNIYSTDKQVFDLQEIILGLGVIEFAKELNLEFDKYHLNESHAFYLPLALMSQYQDLKTVRSKMVFTTHTPLDTANQKITISQVQKMAGDKIAKSIPLELVKDNLINCTEMCIYFSSFANAVAKRHQKITQQFYPSFHIDYVTNGANINTWLCEGLAKIFDKNIDNWRNDPDQLRRIGIISDQELIDNHLNNKQILVDYINKKNGNNNFNSNTFTIGFARRTVGYKRADLILSQIERLSKIAKKYNGIQIVFSGKAYPTDEEGRKLIKSLVDSSKLKFENIQVAFIENYDMTLAKTIILGSDLWLNNPLPPLEASGTSGMKASMNGIPNFSIIDGWWVEGYLEGETGWSIGQDLCVGDMCRINEVEDLYNKLENEIFEAYQDKSKWSQITKTCIALNATHFNTKRVLDEYILKAYLK